MASGASTGGKVLTGCSCLSILFFLVFSAFVQFGLPLAWEALPELAALWSGLAMASIGFNLCCCVSGVGLIVGVVMLLMGKKADGEEG